MKRRPRALLVTGVLLLVALAAYAAVMWREASARERVRQQLLTDVATGLARPQPDNSELSALVARIRRLPDHERDRGLQLALASIDRARSHFQPAWDRLMPLAMAADASPAEQREGARVLLQLHAQRGDRQMGRRAMALAEAAHAHTQDPGDLLMAWQAAQRIQAVEDRERLAGSLIELHAGSREARLLSALSDLERASAEGLAGLRADFDPEPLELGLARAVLLLRDGAAADAVRLLDELCARAPALVDLRHFAAVAYYALAEPPGVTEADRTRYVTTAAAHVEWLLQHAPAEDARRETWRRLLGR